MAASGNILSAFDSSGSMSTDALLSLSRVAETAERYDDMCEFTKALVTQKCGQEPCEHLSVEERNLLSVAFKNVVGAKRASWRTLNAENDCDADVTSNYRDFVENELEKKCQEVLKLLEEQLLPKVKNTKNADLKESEVFYLKMAADYYRYLAEFKASVEEYPKQAEAFYKDAMEVAKDALPETHPTRLGLALNFSVCYYEILKKPDDACALAKEAFDAAIQKLDTLNDSSYKDSTLIMQLLRDNLTLWTSGDENETGTTDPPQGS